MVNKKKTTNTVNNRIVTYGKNFKEEVSKDNAKEFVVNGGKKALTKNRKLKSK